MGTNTHVDIATLPPRKLAKELLRHDSCRGMITDPKTPIHEVVKAIRRGGGGMSGAYGGYDVSVHGLSVIVERSQGVAHEPPIRIGLDGLVREMRREAHAPAPTLQLELWTA